jgi:hypothetical protein
MFSRFAQYYKSSYLIGVTMFATFKAAFHLRMDSSLPAENVQD